MVVFQYRRPAFSWWAVSAVRTNAFLYSLTPNIKPVFL